MKIGIISCGALRPEVKRIVNKYDFNADIIGISPEDHLFPMRIAPDVEKRILKLKANYDHFAVAFGECGTRGLLDKLLVKHNLFRIDAQNCYQMYAGDKYDQYRNQEIGTFFLTDFLVKTFSKSVINGLGLNRFPDLKTEYFHNCTRIVYLIQEDRPELRLQAHTIAEFMGLPLEFHFTGLSILEDHVLKLLNRTEHHFGMPAYKTGCQSKNHISNGYHFTFFDVPTSC